MSGVLCTHNEPITDQVESAAEPIRFYTLCVIWNSKNWVRVVKGNVSNREKCEALFLSCL